jgi:hypothetical protein
MGANSVLRDVFEIASLIISLAVIGLLITRSRDTVAVVSGVSDAFSGLLQTATFQGGSGFGGFNGRF